MQLDFDTLEHDVPLAPLTTLEVGGPARYLARARSGDEVAGWCRWALDRDCAVWPFGGGSNVLISDDGIDALVLTSADETIDIQPVAGDNRAVHVFAGAGVEWDDLVAHAVSERLAGLECLSGIPGRVGAAPIQNIGAYGQEVSEVVVRVGAVDLQTGYEHVVTAEECQFAYRDSRFKSEWRDRRMVTWVELRLTRRDAGRIRYEELARQLGWNDPDRPGPDLASVRDGVLALRRSKSMVIDPIDGDAEPDENRRSVGSFFTNPVVDDQLLANLQSNWPDIPHWPAGDHRWKVPAAALIERSGFTRGTSSGVVGLSTRHALAIVNKGGATAADIVAFASHIRGGVRDALGVTLEPEARFVGFGKTVAELLA